MTLTGKAAVVTGGGSGIGAAVAAALAGAGCDVMIAGRDAAKLDRAAATNPKIVAHAGDVSDRAQASRLIAAATTRFGKVDISGQRGRSQRAQADDVRP